MIVEIIVRCFQDYGGVDFQKALLNRVGLFNEPEIHPTNPCFGLIKCHYELRVFYQARSAIRSRLVTRFDSASDFSCELKRKCGRVARRSGLQCLPYLWRI